MKTKPKLSPIERAAMRAYRMQVNKTLAQLCNMPEYHSAIEKTHRACAKAIRAAQKGK